MRIPRVVARACATSTVAPTTTAVVSTTGLPAPTTNVASTTADVPSTTAVAATTTTGLDYSIPTAWDSPSVPTDYQTLQGTIQDAINGLQDYWPDANAVNYTWDVGTTLSALAYKDTVASTKDNHDYVLTALQHAASNNANFDPYSYNDDAQWWGTTAIYAHRVYGDQQFLDWAVGVWNWVQPSQITDDQAASGTSTVRKSFNGTCNGNSVAGGVFWRSQSSDQTDLDVNVITTSLFMTLSGYLYEATNDTKYIDAAKAAYGFITTHLMQDSPNIPLDTLKLGDCSINNWIFTYNSGKFLEGSVILQQYTGDEGVKNQMLKTLVDAVKNTSNWQDAQGHITEGQGGDITQGDTTRQFKGIYLRALTEIHRRLYTMSDMRSLLERYVSIQWDSITKKDSNGNKYGVVWLGPYTEAQWGQANVLDALVAGLEMNWAR